MLLKDLEVLDLCYCLFSVASCCFLCFVRISVFCDLLLAGCCCHCCRGGGCFSHRQLLCRYVVGFFVVAFLPAVVALVVLVVIIAMLGILVTFGHACF